MAVTTTLKKVRKDIIKCLSVGLVPILKGKPGLGKTHLVLDIADEFNLFTITKLLSQADPTELNGLPDVHGDKAVFKPFADLPVEGDPLPLLPEFADKEHDYEMILKHGSVKEITQFEEAYCYEGFLLFLDELMDAPKMTLNAANSVMLEGKVGQRKLHPKCRIIAASNRLEDKAGASGRMSTATQSRIIHFTIREDVNEFIEYAIARGFKDRITSFIQHMPELLHKFDPNHNDDTFACNRTWDFVHRLTNDDDTISLEEHLTLVAGAVSEGVARDWIGFCQIYKEMVSYEEILENPAKAEMPAPGGTLYAVMGNIASNLVYGDVDKVIVYINRMPDEFKLLLVRQAHQRNKLMIKQGIIKPAEGLIRHKEFMNLTRSLRLEIFAEG